MHTHMHSLAVAHAHYIINTCTPLHLYMHSPILAHTHTLVTNYTYTREMPNISPLLKHLAHKVREGHLKLMQ